MLLRASGEEAGHDVDLSAALGRGSSGVEHGDLLVRFTESALRFGDDLDALRRELIAAVGFAGFVETAATVGIFSGLVRVADATGIPLDRGTLGATVDLRDELALNEFSGARNTDLDAADASAAPRDVGSLFT